MLGHEILIVVLLSSQDSQVTVRKNNATSVKICDHGLTSNRLNWKLRTTRSFPFGGFCALEIELLTFLEGQAFALSLIIGCHGFSREFCSC